MKGKAALLVLAVLALAAFACNAGTLNPQAVYVPAPPVVVTRVVQPTARPATAVPTGPFGCPPEELETIAAWSGNSAVLLGDIGELATRISNASYYDWAGWYSEADSIYRQTRANRNAMPACFRDDGEDAQAYMEDAARDMRDGIGLLGDGNIDAGVAKIQSATRWIEMAGAEFGQFADDITAWGAGM